MKTGGRPPAATTPRALSRRDFLVLGGSVLLLAGCTSAPPGRATTAPPSFTPTPSTDAVHTVATLTATTPFYIAHRGSGDNWPEHTMEAYAGSIAAGVQAIEVSVNATKDGVLICHHDTDMAHTSGANVKIADATWAQLQALHIDASRWLGPAARPQPIPELKDVLDRFARTHVIFIEDKQGTNTAAMLDLMDTYPESKAHFVWKQWAGAAQVKAARERGYATWGYFSPELIPNAADIAADFDYLGAMHTFSDDEIAAIVAAGKPVIVWEVHYRSTVDRLKRLGVVGMMTSNIPYVTHLAAPAKSDAFGTGLRAAGDLPWTVDEGWGAQPAISERGATVTLADDAAQSYLMGSMAGEKAGPATIEAELQWGAGTEGGAGIAFGQKDDDVYRLGVPGPTGGYHALLHADGRLEIVKRAVGESDGTAIASVATTPPSVGEWVALRVVVSATGVAVTRDRKKQWTAAAADTDYSGPYFWLCKERGAGSVAYRRLTRA
jgi:glycerophosphoryl diester phosphodiesterase